MRMRSLVREVLLCTLLAVAGFASAASAQAGAASSTCGAGRHCKVRSITFPDGTRQTTAAESAPTFSALPVLGYHIDHVNTSGTLAFPGLGVQVGTHTNPGGGVPTQQGSSGRTYSNTNTALTAGSIAGLQNNTSNQFFLSPPHLPVVQWRIVTGPDLALTRYWAVVGNSWSVEVTATSEGTGPQVGGGSPRDRRWFGFRLSASAPDANWQCCSADGTTGSCEDTGVPGTASTEYELVADWSGDTLTCTVNGTSVSKSTNLPARTHDAMRIWAIIVTTDAVATARNFGVNSAYATGKNL